MPAATLKEILKMNYTKLSTSSQCAPSVSTRPPVKLHVVKGGSQPPDIFEQVGLSSPNELNQGSSKTIIPEKSPVHRRAIEDVEKFRAKKINATNLKNLYEDTYTNWKDMKSRCGKVDVKAGTSPIDLHPYFIKFADFLSIVGPRPEPTWSLDRIDPTGPYAPDNVRWASKTTQARNRTNTVTISYEGTDRPLTEWAEIQGVDAATYRQRRRLGWSDEEIIEGKRERAHSTCNTPKLTTSRDPFNYTPWPKDREYMESLFQRYGRQDEHRLIFMQRFSERMLQEISEEADVLCWPEDYTPTPEEVLENDNLNKRQKYWQEMHTDARKKRSPDHPPCPYRELYLPDWIEMRLAKYR